MNMLKTKSGFNLKAKDAGSKRPATFSDTSKKSTRSPKRKRGDAPSEEALALSSRLKELSNRKQLRAALDLFWSKANDSIRDAHHACIIIDCCSRCGDCEEGERVAERLKRSGRKLNVEANTALLKGFAHSGEIAKAMHLFENMCTTKAKSDRPNVRTLNTVLRGCLWTPAAVDKNGVVVGGVISSEIAWRLFGDCRSEDQNASLIYDTSAYEASIALLCQALRVDDAEARLQSFKTDFVSAADEASIDQSVLETLAASQLCLARACTLLKLEKKAKTYCREAMKAVTKSKLLLETRPLTDGGPKSKSGGGKRGWRQSTEGDKNNTSDNRRFESNSLYRSHRLDGIENDTKALLDCFHKQADPLPARQFARRLLTRLLVISGGGTTSLAALEQNNSTASVEDMKERARSLQHSLVNSVFASYGLEVVLKDFGMSLKASTNALKRKECNRILGMVGLQGGIVRDDGLLDFQKVFSTGLTDGKTKKRLSKKRQRPVDIELGAGFGEWIVNQAVMSPDRDHIAVEMRADRAGQIFSRTAIFSGAKPLENLCIVGAESTHFLSNYVQPDSVSTIFVNHPEPPTQTFGAEAENIDNIMNGSDEPAHMLNSRMLLAAVNCLKSACGGRIVIVTDNRWYGRLICATLSRVMDQNPGKIRNLDLSDKMSVIERFGNDDRSIVQLHEGCPGESIGHAVSGDKMGTSYFDRLWRTGAGTHSERKIRYVIVVCKI